MSVEDGEGAYLGAIGVFTRIGHRQQHGASVLVSKIFILKLGTINRFSTRSIKRSKVTTLNHKVLDHTVEDGAFVVQRETCFAFTLFTSTQRSKVLYVSMEYKVDCITSAVRGTWCLYNSITMRPASVSVYWIALCDIPGTSAMVISKYTRGFDAFCIGVVKKEATQAILT